MATISLIPVREAVGDDKPQAGQGRRQAAVTRAFTLGKNQSPFAGFQDPNERLQRAAIASFLIDGNDIQFWQEPAEEASVYKGLAREKENCAIGHAADERRIEIALVVRRQDDRAVVNHALAMDDPKPETNPAYQLDEMVAEPVIGIHNQLAS